ncbi:MAG: MmgE/PrpD family protein [Deltaproteobacteria bacterium]|nr:MmgE/PrpD family protein [Deltaproteobacteria bacterium]
MGSIGTLAEFVARLGAGPLPEETADRVARHVLDTAGALLAGSRVPDGSALGRLAAGLGSGGGVPLFGHSLESSLAPAVLALCGAARCTEVDDIHLPSCTTPGSVSVPTALALAAAGYLPEPPRFLAAVAAGYEVLVRVGLALDGARALYRGVWPTYAAAAPGAAAVAACALELDPGRTAHALATALTLTAGAAGRIRTSPSSRWLTLGLAAQNGVTAALAARDGFLGDEGVFDREGGPLHELFPAKARLVEGLGNGYLVEEVSLKPYPTARQALAAVEAFRQLLAEGLEPGEVEEAIVRVPPVYAGMIDQSDPPAARLDSLLNVRYQIALAAYHPERLVDVVRAELPADERVRSLMARIRVEPSPELEELYPRLWPARVEVRLPGRSVTRETTVLPWDSGGGAGWPEVEEKFRRVTAIFAEERSAGIIEAARGLKRLGSTRALLELLG